MNLAGWRLSVQVARTQGQVAVVVALLVWPLSGGHAAASALLGGIVPVCATLSMGFMMFLLDKPTANQALKGLFLGEASRLAVVGLLLVAIFSFTTATPIYVLAGFIVGLVVQILASFRGLQNGS